ncbi:MAG: hypothetical protein D6734_09430 [Candidatus Schekmanbacteria bacterium]|nr:MAG: hypothetical protein D6734_09430 [Candidatus Schekmanbacteria bacterium]
MVLLLKGLIYPLQFNIKSRLGALIGLAAYKMMRNSRNTAIENIVRAIPELSHSQAIKIAKSSFINMGRNVFEAIHLERMKPEDVQKLVEYEGLEYFDKAMKEGKGLVVITGHLGNWEMFQAAMSTLGYPVTVLAQRYSNPYINEMITRIRNASGTSVIIRRSGKERELMKGVLKALANCHALGILIDHYTKKNGIAVPFLNTETSAPAGPALFAMRTGAPVIFGYAMRLPNERFKVKFQPSFKALNGKNRDLALYLNTANFLEAIEEEILNYPEQWAWMHKFKRKHRKSIRRIDFKKLPKVTIFSKKECCLCDDAKKIIEKISRRYPFKLEAIDITDDKEKLDAYGNEVPVVLIEGKKLFKLGVDKKRFEKRIIDYLYNMNSDES